MSSASSGSIPPMSASALGIGVDVRADDPIGVVDPQVSRHACTDIAAVGAVALVPEAAHQLHPCLRGTRELPAGVGERAGEPEPGERRNDHVERICRVASVGSRIGERADEIHELGERARIPVRDDQRQRVRLGRTDVQEVDRLAVDRGGELREPVERRLVLPPVVLGSPILGQVLQVPERHAPAPPGVGRLVGPTGAGEPLLEIVDVPLGNFDPERTDRRRRSGQDRTCDVSSLLARPRPGEGGGEGSRMTECCHDEERIETTGCCQSKDRERPIQDPRRGRPQRARRPGLPAGRAAGGHRGLAGRNRPARPAHAGGCWPRSKTGPRPSRRSRGAWGLARQSVQRVADVLVEERFCSYEENPGHRRAQLLRITPRGRPRPSHDPSGSASVGRRAGCRDRRDGPSARERRPRANDPSPLRPAAAGLAGPVRRRRQTDRLAV